MRTGINLTVGSSLLEDFTLQVGQSNQTVTVAAEVAQVDTNTSTLANLVETKQMVDLPLNGRNFQQLILLAPGVTVAQTATTSFYGKGDTYSIAGARPEGAAYLLDGTDITNFFNHGSGAGSLGTSLGIDAIAEFQTLTNTYSAQFGGNGAVINAVSKSGTNAFHGTAFEFLRNSALDARDFFEPTSSPKPFRRNQFGGALGGPIKKDKMFFFVNYEELKQSLGITNKITVPDANAHAGFLPCAVASRLRVRSERTGQRRLRLSGDSAGDGAVSYGHHSSPRPCQRHRQRVLRSAIRLATNTTCSAASTGRSRRRTTSSPVTSSINRASPTPSPAPTPPVGPTPNRPAINT